MQVTFELTKEMIENELLSIFYNTFGLNGGFGEYRKSPISCNFIKHVYEDYRMKIYWREKINPNEIHSFDIFETPFGKYAFVHFKDSNNCYDCGVFKLTNTKGRKMFKYIGCRYDKIWGYDSN